MRVKKRILNVPIEIFCYTQINDLMHDRVFFTISFHHTTNALKHSRSINKRYLVLLIYDTNMSLYIYLLYKHCQNIYEYLDARISPTSVRYIISSGNQLNNNKRGINRIQGVEIIGLLRRNNLEEKGIKIYVNGEQHLPYWILVNKKENVVILPQTGPSISYIHIQRGIYFNA